MKPEHFKLPLSRTLKVKDGRPLVTLMDAVNLMGILPEHPRLSPVWLLACEAIGRAATTGSQADLENATCEIELALAADNLSDDALKGLPLHWGGR